jgi:hypothetical protein
MATLPSAPVASQESSNNFPLNLIGKKGKYGNITFNREEKITPAERGILFPPQKTKNSFSGGHQKIPCQHRGFPVSERFGKKNTGIL